MQDLVEDIDFTFKTIILGDCAVGKTTFFNVLKGRDFECNTTSTSTAFYESKLFFVEGNNIKVNIWDTPGFERFRFIRDMYIIGAAGVLVLYDVTSRESFLSVPSFIEDIVKKYHKVVIMIVGMKVDLEDRTVSKNEGLELAQSYGVMFAEASGKIGYNIKESFELL